MTDLTDQQKDKLLKLEQAMLKVAEPVGSVHAWWDYISSIRVVLRTGEDHFFGWTCEQVIEQAENALRRGGFSLPY